MKYVLLFMLLTPAGTLAPAPHVPTCYFDSLWLCEETSRHRVVQESWRGIYGDDLVMVCAPVEK